MSKIGIFGGSFNPIHNGHLYVAEKVKKILCLDNIIFIPTGIAPHKNNGDFVSKEHRYNMVKLAVEDKFDVSDIEIKTDKVCYAIDTMSQINTIYKNDDLYYIIGADSLVTFMQWKEPLKLFEMLHIVVVDRNGADIDNVAEIYRQKYGARITICHIDEYDVSSSEIRNQIKITGKCNGLVPEKTEEYIIKHKLYTEDL